jgi:hypothetical protein
MKYSCLRLRYVTEINASNTPKKHCNNESHKKNTILSNLVIYLFCQKKKFISQSNRYTLFQLIRRTLEFDVDITRQREIIVSFKIIHRRRTYLSEYFQVIVLIDMDSMSTIPRYPGIALVGKFTPYLSTCKMYDLNFFFEKKKLFRLWNLLSLFFSRPIAQAV